MPDETREESSPDAAVTVYYDRTCPVCRAGADAFADAEAGDGCRLAWVDINAAPDALASHHLGVRDIAWKLRVTSADGSVLNGAAGAAVYLQATRRWAWLGRLMSRPGFRELAAIGYHIAASLLFTFNSLRRTFSGKGQESGVNTRP